MASWRYARRGPMFKGSIEVEVLRIATRPKLVRAT